LLPSCNGLMSTERLLDLACVAKPERDALLRVHRPDNIRLSDSMVIRDQRPMPPAALVRALDGGLKPSDWYALLKQLCLPVARPEAHGEAAARLRRPPPGRAHVQRRCSIRSVRG
jgi:hypothetical protein